MRPVSGPLDGPHRRELRMFCPYSLTQRLHRRTDRGIQRIMRTAIPRSWEARAGILVDNAREGPPYRGPNACVGLRAQDPVLRRKRMLRMLVLIGALFAAAGCEWVPADRLVAVT